MGKWSMKADRLLLQLARDGHNAEKIAAKMDKKHSSVERAANRLGVVLPPSPPRPDGRFKAKGKERAL